MKKSILALLILLLLKFVIASDYSGSFILDKDEVQLGDEFTLSGNIYKNNNILEDQINAIIYFKGPNSTKEVYVSVFEGTFSITNKFKKTPAGSYQIDVKILDLDGNTLDEFTNVESLTIEDTLQLGAELKTDKLSPGDELKIKGTVRRALDSQPVEKATIKIHIDNLVLTTDATNGEFEYSFTTSPTIKSNYHDIKIVAEDDYGNKGEDTERLFIEPKPTALIIELEKESYLPSETVHIKPELLDQAKEPMLSDAEIRIYNPNNKRLIKETSETGKIYDYTLDKYAKPGQWKIKIKAQGIETEKIFEVKEVESLEIKLLPNNILQIENTGNIKYEKLLEIKENEEVIRKRTNIDPGESFQIDLNKELSKGQHEILILNTNQTFTIYIEKGRSLPEKILDSLSSLTGQAIGKPGTAPSSAPTYSFIVMLLVIILLLAYRFKIAKRRTKYPQPKKEKPKFSLLTKFKTKRKEKAEIKELKEKILSDIEKPQEQNQPQPQEDKKPLRINFDEPFKFN
jgi:hypothetical protein